MEAGRELDALVAEKVFGVNVVKSRRKDGYAYYTDGEPNWAWIRFEGSELLNAIPCYSTDISAAFEVINKVMPRYRSKISIETYEGEIWSIKPCGTNSSSLPHAICLAALKAVSKQG